MNRYPSCMARIPAGDPVLPTANQAVGRASVHFSQFLGPRLGAGPITIWRNEFKTRAGRTRLNLSSIRLFLFHMRWLPSLSLPRKSLQPSPSHPLQSGQSSFSFSVLTRARGAGRHPLLRSHRPKMKVRRNQLCDHDHCLQHSCSLSFHI